MPEARQPTPMFAPSGQVRASTAMSAVQRRCHPGPAALLPAGSGNTARPRPATAADTASGKLTERPELTLCLGYLRAGDTLVVWRLDRLGRSLRHLVETVNALAKRGVAFASLHEGIDTTTSTGRLVFHIFAALAEFERELIAERAAVGRAAARARGRAGPRPRGRPSWQALPSPGRSGPSAV